MSQLQVDTILNTNGDGAPDFPNGMTVTGVVTATTLNQNVSGILTATSLSLSGDITGVDNLSLSGDINATGVITATTFSGAFVGNGSGLTGVTGPVSGVANGSIGLGTAVAVQSDGKFAAITGTNAVSSNAVASGQTPINNPTACYDTVNDKVVVVWHGHSDDDCYAMVGTISGTTITWGTPVKYDGTNNSRPNAVAYDSTHERIIIVGNQDWGGTISSCVGQVSGTGASATITFGTKVQVVASGHSYPSIAFDPTTGRVICAYRDTGDGKGYAKIGTISGSTVTWGSETQWDTGGVEKTRVAAGGGYAVVVGSGHGSPARYRCGQISSSGNSITWGTEGTIASITGDTAMVAVDPNTNIWAIQAVDPASSTVKLHPAIRSGSSLTFGTAKNIYSGSGPHNNQSLCWTGGKNLFFSTFSANNAGGQQWLTSTINADASGFNSSSAEIFHADNSSNDQPDYTASTSSPTGKCIIWMRNAGNSNAGWVAVEQVRMSNGTTGSYVGLSNAAYTDGQTAKVDITGAVNTNQSGLTPGTRYYLMADGTLNATADGENILVGNALSATNILLR